MPVIKKGKLRGVSYAKRVRDVNAIYDQYSRSGLSNREIYRRYVYPVYAMSERAFYNTLNASVRLKEEEA
jgi:hypothetical protein